MAAVLSLNDVVSKPGDLSMAVRRRIGWFLDNIGKYAVDFSANFSIKGKKGLPQLHKTVQEELKDRASLKVCNNQEMQKHDTMSRSEKETTKMEKMQEEMNKVKLKNGLVSEKLERISSNKLPPEQTEKKNFLIPDRKRIMIRSRL